MISDKKDDWKLSFRYELRCCLFGFLYGAVVAMSLMFIFVIDEIILLVCPLLLLYIFILNIKIVKPSVKALLIEIPIAIGSFFLTYIMFSLLGLIRTISID